MGGCQEETSFAYMLLFTFVIKQLGLINTLWAVILPMAINVYNFSMRNFFEGIPESLFEAAQIDGCSPMGIFFKIVLPLSKAALASIGLMFAVSFWNDYTNSSYMCKRIIFTTSVQLSIWLLIVIFLMMVLLTQQQFLMQQLS